MSDVETRSYVEDARRENRSALEAAGIPPFAYAFGRSHLAADALSFATEAQQPEKLYRIGYLTDAPGPTLHQLVKTQSEGRMRDVILNLKNVGFIDSYGVGQILSIFISIHDLGGRLKLCCVPQRLLLIFDVTGLSRVLEMHADCDTALKSFETP